MSTLTKKLFIAATAILITGSVLVLCHRHSTMLSGRRIVCVMESLPVSHVDSELVFGYNYQVIKQLAKNLGVEAEIVPAKKNTRAIDCLKASEADMAVVPDTTLIDDKVQLIDAYDCSGFWVFRQDEKKLAKAFRRELEKYRKSEGYISERNLFFREFSPLGDAAKGKKTEYISPYDHLFKAAADSTGFDWRFLAAIAFQESRFHIDAVSRYGASGLMQLMPATAKRMNATNLLDPEESISSAANYLKLLYKRYRRAANEDERLKFTLAGYNAGEGRIKLFTSMADSLGIDRSYWNNVSELFDEADKFEGTETRCFVDRVMSIYKAMCKITEP